MAHNPAGHFHHGGIHDIYVYPDDYFNDVDHNHADTDELDHDVVIGGFKYEHVGTYNRRSEHDNRVYFDYLDRYDDIADDLRFTVNVDRYPERSLVVVHRRVSSDR